MEISIVIPCYNAEDTLAAQLEALSNQFWEQPWEIIVANNRCTDGSMAIVEKYQKNLPQLRIVDASKKQGQPYALNCGIKAANGKYIILCDADDIVGNGWLVAYAKALVGNHDFVACSFEIERLNSEFALGRGKTQVNGLQKIWYPPYLPHAGGGTLAFKKTLFEEVGGFDETLLCLHDTDFCFKAHMLGVELHFVPDAIIHIRYQDTFKGIIRQSKNYAEYNVLLANCYSSSRMIDKGVWLQYFLDWWKIVKKLPKLRSKSAQGHLSWLLGRQIGRFSGVMKYHAPPI